jgi:hypothetical protein
MRLAPLARALLAPVCLTGALLAQTQNVVWHPNNSPTGGGNAFPWGSLGIRYQTIVSAAAMGNKPSLIQDVFVAGYPNSTDLEIVYEDIEIRMGMTAQATPTTDWNTNNPNPRVVYRGPLRVRFVVGQWRGIGLPNTFLYLPTATAPNLCFEVIVWKTSTGVGNFYFPANDASTQRAFLYQWTTTQGAPNVGGGANKMGLLLYNGNFVVVGTGCTSSTNTTLEAGASTWPQPNQPVDITLTGAKPVSVAALMLGTSFTQYGALALPFDLGPLGAAGCKVWNDILVVGAAVVDPTGKAKLTLPIPSAPGTGRLYMHWFNHDPTANKFGWTTSSQLKLLLGS